MSSTPSNAATAPRAGGGRTFGSGSRRSLVVLATVAILAGGGLAAALGLSNSGSRSSSLYTYHKGKIPAWIPDTKAPANPGPITASLVKPVSTLVEGDTIHAIFPAGMAMVTAVGPSEPDWVEQDIQEGHSKWGQRSPGTFYITYTDVQGNVPVAARGFAVLTPQGNFRADKIAVKGGGQVPSVLHHGQSLTLLLHYRLLPAGEGAIAWTPSPRELMAGWDFDFELT